MTTAVYESCPSSDQHPTTTSHNNNSSSVDVPDLSKKEAFRQYLATTGVLDAITTVLVGLYEEPEREQVDALDYVRQYLGTTTAVDWQGVRNENEQLRQRVAQLERQIAEYEHSSGSNEAS